MGRINISRREIQHTETDPDGEQYTYSDFIRSDERNYYIKDHLGSIRVTVDQNGVTRQAQDYYAYGSTLRGYNSSLSNSKYQFTGKERDSDTQLDYFGARYYDSEIGHWMSPDPLKDKYPGWSPYNYCLNNPMRFIDPKGEIVVNPYDKKKQFMFWLYVESAINTLKESETGLELYNELNNADQEFTVEIGYIDESTYGNFVDQQDLKSRLFDTEPKLESGKIILNARLISKYGECPAAVLGHEFKHASMALRNYKRFVWESSNYNPDVINSEGPNATEPYSKYPDEEHWSYNWHEKPAYATEEIIRNQLKQKSLLKNNVHKK